MLTKKDFKKNATWWIKDNEKVDDDLVIGVLKGAVCSYKDGICSASYAMANLQELVEKHEKALEDERQQRISDKVLQPSPSGAAAYYESKGSGDYTGD